MEKETAESPVVEEKVPEEEPQQEKQKEKVVSFDTPAPAKEILRLQGEAMVSPQVICPGCKRVMETMVHRNEDIPVRVQCNLLSCKLFGKEFTIGKLPTVMLKEYKRGD